MCLASCSSEEGGGAGAARKIPVKAIKVEAQPVQQTLAVIGHVEPSASVKLAAQVDGQLMQSLVRPGHHVKAGQLLFVLDPRSFEAAVSQAEAVLARDNAKLALARQDLTRYKGLAARDFLSKQQYEQSLTEVAALEATISEDKALLEAAEVELGHTSISAPISGRAGEVLVDPGNIVTAGDTSLLVINTISPAEVSFAVPEKYLPELNRRLRAGAVEVRVLPEGDRGEAVSGELVTIDNAVNRDTGTVSMRAAFANIDERLWPGQFVRVYIVMEEVPDALVIPFRAVLEGVSGQYVYVLTTEEAEKARNTPAPDTADSPDSSDSSALMGSSDIPDILDTSDAPKKLIAVVRPVITVLLDGSSLQVLEGLKAGETVITEGQLNLFPNAPVEDISGKAAAASGAPESAAFNTVPSEGPGA